MGSGALFSKSFGAGKTEEMKQDICLSFGFIGAATIMIDLLVFPGTDFILHLLSVPGEIYDLMRGYVRIIFIGIGFTFLYNFFAYLLRAIGNSVVPLIFLAVSSVMNIVLDLYFVISLQWGRIGAIMKNDVLTGLQQSVMNLGILMIQGLVNSFGTTVMAAFAAAVKIDTLAYMPAQEFGNAYSLFISQNYGAKKKDRIHNGTKIATIVSASFCVVISAVIWLFSRPFMEMFVDPTETAIISEGVKYLRIEGSFYFGIGILFLFYGYYRAVQRAEMSLALTIISLGTRVLLSYLLAPNTPFGVNAVWWSIPIGWILADLAGMLYYRKIVHE